MTARRAGPGSTSGICALGALLATMGLGCAPVDLGTDPDFLWWSDHETGDLADWVRGGSELGASYTQNGDVAVSTDVARSGTHALRSTVMPGGMAAAQVWRGGLAAPAAYYGAWFFLPAVAQPTTYWVFFAFRARTAPGTDLPTWDLKLASAGGGLELQLLRHDTGDVAPLAHVPVPLGRWFQVEAFYVPAADARGRLQVWLDGATVYDLAEATAPADGAAAPVTWTLGTITDGLTPAPAVLYVDDAYVCRRRLGPGFPPFWRGH